MKKNPVFYLISTAGFPNLGDEWITLSWLEAIFKRFPEASVFLDVHFPAGFIPLIKTRPYRKSIHCIDLFWQTTYPYADQPWDCSLRNFREIYTHSKTSHTTLSQLSDILPDITHIHFLGGGYCTGFWQHHFFLFILAALFKEQYGLPIYWTGGSVNTVTDVQLSELLPFLSCFDYLSFRDIESVVKLKPFFFEQVYLTSDDLVLGLAMNSIRLLTQARQPTLLINLQSDLIEVDGVIHIHQTCLEKIRTFQKNGFQLLYFEFNPECDSEGFHFLSQNIQGIQRISFAMLWKATTAGNTSLAIVHPASYALGSRFHFHYYLAWQGIAGEYISETPYYDIKHESICDIGSNWTHLHHQPTILQKPTLYKERLIRNKLAEFDRIYPR